MDVFYVASRIRYALVEATNEADAWVAGHEVLHRLHAELMDQTGEEFPVEVHQVRPATSGEIANWERHANVLDYQTPVLQHPTTRD